MKKKSGVVSNADQDGEAGSSSGRSGKSREVLGDRSAVMGTEWGDTVTLEVKGREPKVVDMEQRVTWQQPPSDSINPHHLRQLVISTNLYKIALPTLHP